MSRFATANSPATTDSWNPHNIPDRVVLPPLTTTVDNPLSAPSRRQSVASPTFNGTGSYPFTNTFDQPRPPTASSSPGLSSVRMDMTTQGHDNASHPYRRPSMTSRSQSAMSRSGAISPLVPDLNGRVYQDPQMNWSIPPPNNGSDSRPSTGAYTAYPDYGATEFSAGIPTSDHNPPQSPSFSFAPSGFPHQQSVYINPRSTHSLTLAQAAALATQTTPSPSNASSIGIDSNDPTRQALEEELAQLRTKVRELEFVNDLVQLRVVELEKEKADAQGRQGGANQNGARNSPSSQPPVTQEFQASWEARTEARIKRFCSLNRAGNALCAWHDSRRERRAYPPRMAPPGTLNCGCTYEEALFEESLSRHRVGSYLPGEMVRMDPALRNPLLSLLQWRYGYKDGDFERDPNSGQWVEGEGEQLWQAKAAAGASSSRRHRTEDGNAS